MAEMGVCVLLMHDYWIPSFGILEFIEIFFNSVRNISSTQKLILSLERNTCSLCFETSVFTFFSF